MGETRGLCGKCWKIIFGILLLVFLLKSNIGTIQAQAPPGCQPGQPCTCGGYGQCLGENKEVLQTVSCSGNQGGGCTAIFNQPCPGGASSTCSWIEGDACGSAIWPQCGGGSAGGWCPEGTVCIAGAARPCHCATPKSCSDVINQNPDPPVVTRTSPTTATITYNKTNSQYVNRMSLIMAEYRYGIGPFSTNCTGNYANKCVVNEQNINPFGTGTDTYQVSGLTAGTFYNVAIKYYTETAPGWMANCSANAGESYLSSCLLTPDPLNLAGVGAEGTLTSETVDIGFNEASAVYTSSLTSVATVTSPDNLYPFTTRVTAVANGAASVTGRVRLWKGGQWVEKCTDGATVTVGAPTATPTPTPTPSPTPVPVGTITIRAVEVDPSDTSCATIKAVPTTAGEINGTTHQFTPSSASQPAPKTQAGANYVTFSNIVTGSYTLDPLPPTADWVFARACSTNLDNGTTGEGLSRTLPANTTIRWDVGYTRGTSWVQTQAGDVYAASTLRSFVPAVTPRVFNGDSDTGYPGVVTYGTTFDFDSDPFATGGTLISSTNWQVNTSRSRINYYDFFYRRYGSPTTPTTNSAFANLTAVTKPPSSATPYYVVGNMTTSGNWSIADGQTIIIIVDGNVTIGGNIRFTGTTGFFAIISNGIIRVSNAIGRASTSTVSNIDGVYIAMNEGQTGRIETGTSIAAATARLVGNGVFIADEFLLQRDLDGFGVGNTGAAAELFTYDPRLLVTMPEGMRELSVTWSEVAP